MAVAVLFTFPLQLFPAVEALRPVCCGCAGRGESDDAYAAMEDSGNGGAGNGDGTGDGTGDGQGGGNGDGDVLGDMGGGDGDGTINDNSGDFNSTSSTQDNGDNDHQSDFDSSSPDIQTGSGVRLPRIHIGRRDGDDDGEENNRGGRDRGALSGSGGGGGSDNGGGREGSSALSSPARGFVAKGDADPHTRLIEGEGRRSGGRKRPGRRDGDEDGDREARRCCRCDPALMRERLLRAVLVLICTAISYSVNNVGLMVSAFGCLCQSALAMLPCIMHARLVCKGLYPPPPPTPRSGRRRGRHESGGEAQVLAVAPNATAGLASGLVPGRAAGGAGGGVGRPAVRWTAAIR